jgi:folate-dependent phosphoribosylglycinamide formyltransferase PurN
MRIVLFTLDDTDFVPQLLKPLLDKRRDDIVAAFISPSIFDWRFMKKRVGFLLRNRYPFCIRPSDWVRFLLNRTASADQPASMHSFFHEFGIPAETISEIRTDAIRAKLRALEPDVFLFCPFNRIAGPKFLAIPRLGTFNMHLGKLPEHKGGLSAFWVLRFGDAQAGASLHRVIEQIDEGEIVGEVRFPVRTNVMRELMNDTTERAGLMLVEALDRIATNSVTPIDISGRSEGYYFLPSWRDFREFYRRGCRLM